MEIQGGLDGRFHSEKTAEVFTKENFPLIFEVLHSMTHVSAP